MFSRKSTKQKLASLYAASDAQRADLNARLDATHTRLEAALTKLKASASKAVERIEARRLKAVR
jgi:hypothetical protein